MAGKKSTIIKYAYRIETYRVKESRFKYRTFGVNNPTDAVKFAESLIDSDIEKFVVVYLDAKNNPSCITINNGTVDYTVTYPREVAKNALLSGATSVVLIHNHPSGGINPSNNDKELTKLISSALKLFSIKVHDHIIIGDNGEYFSFSEQGLM